MPEIREAIKEFDELIKQAEALKDRILKFRETGPDASFKQTKTLQLLASAADHIIDNLSKMKARVITDLRRE